MIPCSNWVDKHVMSTLKAIDGDQSSFFTQTLTVKSKIVSFFLVFAVMVPSVDEIESTEPEYGFPPSNNSYFRMAQRVALFVTA